MSDQYTITFDFDPSKPKARNTIISAARKGEMPVVKLGAFGERHKLLDEVYGEVLTRKAKPVKLSAPKNTKAKADQLVHSEESTDATPSAEPEAQDMPPLEESQVTEVADDVQPDLPTEEA
jgi:hypothetical protein